VRIAALVIGLLFCLGAVLDAFQTIILPRRPVGRLRITRVFFLLTWKPWVWLGGRLRSAKVREQMYSLYGPAALLVLFVVWALSLTVAYALLYFGLGMPFNDPVHPVTALGQLKSCLYVSGTTIFTLGLGDVQPASWLARMLIVLEAGTGLGFVALVIGYVPVLYGAFSSREIAVALLDARAGSPPTAGELLSRHSFKGGDLALMTLLAEWERWCAATLETHISYPLLCYYRSQHDNQSWLSALVAVMDTCALLITALDLQKDGGPSTRQAQLTFAIARHTLVDLGHVFHRERREAALLAAPLTRLTDEEYARLCELLAVAGYSLCGDGLEAHERLTGLRQLYEPQAMAMAEYLRPELPKWVPPAGKQKGVWGKIAELRSPAAIADTLAARWREEH